MNNASKAIKAVAVNGLRHQFKIIDLCKIAGISRSTYYYQIRHNTIDKYLIIKKRIQVIYAQHRGRYGYRRVTAVLQREGLNINHKTVYRLMKEMELMSNVRVKKYRSYKGSFGKIAPNLLSRNFQADRPRQKWVTDVTEFKIHRHKLYLSPILDLFNGEIVSYSIFERPVMQMVTSMLEQAFDKVPDNTGITLHSDQGWHYQMPQYRQMLIDKGIHQSMSRKGNCLDNAVIENFFGHLKSEMLYNNFFMSKEELIRSLHDYIEYYNHERIKKKLGYLSPVDIEIALKRLNSLPPKKVLKNEVNSNW